MRVFFGLKGATEDRVTRGVDHVECISEFSLADAETHGLCGDTGYLCVTQMRCSRGKGGRERLRT